MKLLSSPHSNSSSFDPKLCISASATASCLTAILRRFLCSQTLPTHPSRHTNVTPPSSSYSSSSCHQPGIVGRLMGLDSFPCSVSPIDHQKVLNLKHKPIPSKLSFLELPAFFEVENEDFFLLTFDKTETSCCKRNERRDYRRRRKRKVTSRRSNENTSKTVHLGRREDKEFDDKVVVRVLSNEDSTQLTRKKNRSTEEQQDSSPVSVFDFDQFLFDPVAKSGDCTVRRKLSSRLEDYSPSYTDENCAENDQDSQIPEEACQWSGNPTKHHLNKQGEICRLAKAQVVQWIWKFNDVEDISADFGSGIMDQLLQEVVDQFLT